MEDTQFGTNKKELELEVYSEGFVYKIYYDGRVDIYTTRVIASLVPRPFLYGWGEKGEGRVW